jgi:magnesium transporter
MTRFLKRVSKKPGLSPGSLIHVGEKKMEKVRIRVIDYNEGDLDEREMRTIEESFSYLEKPTVTWINIDGVHDPDVIRKIGNHLDLHPLVLEDILHTDQRAKVEDFEDYLFVIVKMLSRDDGAELITANQFSVILGSNYVLTFQERVGDVFNPVRERIRWGRGRIRSRGADYLAYALIDAVVDHYFTVLEKLGERIESLDEEVTTRPIPETLQRIYQLKRELIFLRKSIWPLREVIGELERGESDLIDEKTVIFLRDVYDHGIQIIDIVETFRDVVSGMFDIYLSSVSNRMNETMRVLTVIATIFIPLTFVAGIYGMNFKSMPELDWIWGYPLIWGVMILVALFMLVYFKRKRWL